MSKEGSEGYYLGVDIGTQSLKAACISATGSVVCQCAVVYDEEFPEFGTKGGMIVDEQTSRAIAPVDLWLQALDLLLLRLKQTGVDLSKVKAVSGAAQQHGSIYWREATKLKELDATLPLAGQVSNLLSLPFAPIWADSSTTKECAELEASYGGPEEVARLTGSRAYERFTVNQIAKVYRENAEAYSATKHITLISNGFASIFAGRIVPMDRSDAGGTNCYDYTNRQWLEDLNDRVCPGLVERLGESPVDGATVFGKITQYFVNRYGFSEECQVAAFTGDNPASLVGICGFQRDPTVMISLGTSDTVFAADRLQGKKPQLFGHLFPHPLRADDALMLLCYKNGSHTRDAVKGDFDWAKVSSLLLTREAPSRRTKYLLGFIFQQPEITPNTKQGKGEFIYCVDLKSGEAARVHNVSAIHRIICCIESRFIAMRHHIERFGIDTEEARKVVVTGGGSQNTGVLQIVADILQATVYTARAQDSSNLGAAKLALYSLHGDTLGGFEEELTPVATPQETYPKILLQKYQELEAALVAELEGST